VETIQLLSWTVISDAKDSALVQLLVNAATISALEDALDRPVNSAG